MNCVLMETKNCVLMSLTLKSVRSGRTDCIGELPLTRKQDFLLSTDSVVMYAILMLVFLACNCMVTTKSVKYHTKRALYNLITISLIKSRQNSEYTI